MLTSPIAVALTLAVFVGLASPSPAQKRREGSQEWRSVVYIRRDSETGICSLTARDYLMQQLALKPRQFRLLSLWRYDPSAKRWAKLNRNGEEATEIKGAAGKVHNWEMDQTLFVLPSEVGLFWVEWSEDERMVSTLAVSGPVLCNDIEIGEPPKGMIAACVPSVDSARALFVPDPAIHCRP